jgi:hypothetical protein
MKLFYPVLRSICGGTKGLWSNQAGALIKYSNEDKNNMTKIVNAVTFGAAVVLASSLAVVMPALAQTSASAGINVEGSAGIHNGANGGMRRGGMPFGILGTVSATNGDSISVAAKAAPSTSSTTATTYTVDATNAKIYKGSPTSTVSVGSIAVGDTIMVQGTVSGTNVIATVIRDGALGTVGRPSMMPGEKGIGGRGSVSSTKPVSPIAGNGEPVVGGAVTAVSGTSITVTNASNVTYTINAASSTIVKNGTSSAIGNIAVGDTLIVQGTVNGSSVTASSIIDQGVHPTIGSSTAPKGDGGAGAGGFGGFFGSIGGFFKHLFGF